jgi:hypothetical protein
MYAVGSHVDVDLHVLHVCNNRRLCTMLGFMLMRQLLVQIVCAHVPQHVMLCLGSGIRKH